MTEIYLHFRCAHYGLSGNAPVGGGLLPCGEAGTTKMSEVPSSACLESAIWRWSLQYNFTYVICHACARIKYVCKISPLRRHWRRRFSERVAAFNAYLRALQTLQLHSLDIRGVVASWLGHEDCD